MSALFPDFLVAIGFVPVVASFTPGGVDQDDDSDTINSLRARAREILELAP